MYSSEIAIIIKSSIIMVHVQREHMYAIYIQAFIGHSLNLHLNPKSTDVPWIHLRKAADLDYKLVISEIVTRIQYQKMIYLSIIRNEISHT